VIIVQGDHGWVAADPENRMRILNAYYLPQGGDQKLYEGISPVNSFRLVLDHYFGAGYNFLKDDSYYSTYQLPFKFSYVIDHRAGCQK
jgi:hypothetical protein